MAELFAFERDRAMKLRAIADATPIVGAAHTQRLNRPQVIGSSNYTYILKTAWFVNGDGDNECTADIYETEGMVLLEEDVRFVDQKEKNYVQDQVVDSRGDCYRSGETYFPLQGPCEPEDDGTGSGGLAPMTTVFT